MLINKLVEYTLRDNPRSRDSDKELLLSIWEKCGFYLSETQKAKFLDLPSAETIRRIRQKIQESGKYPATDRVRASRRVKGLVIQQNAPIAQPQRLESLFDVADYTIKKRRWE